MTRFINILILSQDPFLSEELKVILLGKGNNILLSETIEDAIQIINNKNIGIVLLDLKLSSEFKKASTHLSSEAIKKFYSILICHDNFTTEELIKGLKAGSVDNITLPIIDDLVKSKVDVFKSLYFKNKRIDQLLLNIFPQKVLEEFSTKGKYAPKNIDSAVVMFTDFVNFSLKSKTIASLVVIKQLERHFTKFDHITEKYQIEKIKTIGDAYMCVAGVTEDLPSPEIRMCLAALEIRTYIENEKAISIATNKTYWDIRIGIHQGPLVAGIIGQSKYSFDVWGDTVNIAARAESDSHGGEISITKPIYEGVWSYFHTHFRGNLEIKKRGGTIEMYFLENLKTEYSMFGEKLLANKYIRSKCGLSQMDFEHLRSHVVHLLKSLLPEYLSYHDINHTFDVERSAIRIAELEGVSKEDIILLRTACLFHDSGYIVKPDKNEDDGIQIAKATLPEFGYSSQQILQVVSLIEATKRIKPPGNLLEAILCDADLDYIGRPDYKTVAEKLRSELNNTGKIYNEEEWIIFQLDFVENKHQFYTNASQNIRSRGKDFNINKLKKQLSELV